MAECDHKILVTLCVFLVGDNVYFILSKLFVNMKKL